MFPRQGMQGFKPSGGLTILGLQRIYFFKMPREGENVPRGILGRADWPRVGLLRARFRDLSIPSAMVRCVCTSRDSVLGARALLLLYAVLS